MFKQLPDVSEWVKHVEISDLPARVRTMVREAHKASTTTFRISNRALLQKFLLQCPKKYDNVVHVYLGVLWIDYVNWCKEFNQAEYRRAVDAANRIKNADKYRERLDD